MRRFRVLIALALLAVPLLSAVPCRARDARGGRIRWTKPLKQPKRWQVEQRQEMENLAARILQFAEGHWDVKMEEVEYLRGWGERQIHATAMHFEDKEMMVEAYGVPAAFRLTVSSLESPGKFEAPVLMDAEVDLVLGTNDRHTWFYHGGTFDAGYPRWWKGLIAKLRREFDVPQPSGGIQCRIECPVEVFGLGGPVELCVRARNVSGDQLQALDTRDAVKGAFSIRSETFQWKQYSGPALLKGQPVTLEPWDDLYVCVPNVSKLYGLDEPGRYIVKVPYRYGSKADQIAYSQEAAIQIVPREFLVLTLKRVGEDKPLKRDEPIPVSVGLARGLEESELLMDLDITFHAVETELLTELWGLPGSAEKQPPLPRNYSLTKGTHGFDYDLRDEWWGFEGSKAGAFRKLWGTVKPGETWRVHIVLKGRCAAGRFRYQSTPLEIRIADE